MVQLGRFQVLTLGNLYFSMGMNLAPSIACVLLEAVHLLLLHFIRTALRQIPQLDDAGTFLCQVDLVSAMESTQQFNNRVTLHSYCFPLTKP